MEFVVFQTTVDPAEQLFVGGVRGGGVGQGVAAARLPRMSQKQLTAELLLQPAVETTVPFPDGINRRRGIGQQQIAMSAAAVNQVGAGEAAAGQKLVDVMLHQQFQKEGAAAQGFEGARGVDGVQELLDAGNISGI